MTDADLLASAASSVLEAEAERQAADDASRRRPVFADDLLPGVGDEEMSLPDGLRAGGKLMFVVLLLLVAFDELEGAALSVLAPDIRDTFGVSDGTIVFIVRRGRAFFVLGAVPMGWLADRVRRGRIVGWASLAVLGRGPALRPGDRTRSCCSGPALGSGIAKAEQHPGAPVVDRRQLPDRRPRPGRRDDAMVGPRASASLSPVLVGGIAAWPGDARAGAGRSSCSAIPVGDRGLLRLPPARTAARPVREEDVLGEVIEDEQPAPISMEAAFARLRQIRTIRTVLVAFAALGFGLFTDPVLANLYLEDAVRPRRRSSRGLIGTVSGHRRLVRAALRRPAYFDRLYRRDPAKALALVGC